MRDHDSLETALGQIWKFYSIPPCGEGGGVEAPTKVGLYQIRCGEGDNEWEYVAVTLDQRGLMVHDQMIGVYDVVSYHNGLTNLEWKFIV